MRIPNSTTFFAVMALALVLPAGLLLGGCSEEHHHEAPPAAATEANRSEAARSEATTPLGRLVQTNFELVEALSQDDPAGARTAAQSARQALGQVEGDEALAASVQAMDQALKQLVEAEDI